jgi:hypothetical protein
LYDPPKLTASPRTHYLNSDFDLSLRPCPQQLDQPRLARQIRELTVQALLGADPGDSALVRAEVPQSFLAHLTASGITVPRLLCHPQVDAAACLRPFGWNAEAIELNRLHPRPVKHPPLESIRRVNSRSFALELEAELAPRGPLGSLVESPAELDTVLLGAPAASGWVIKAEHGNAGLANRRLDATRITPADRRFVDQLFREDDRLVVEPWLTREHDWSVVFGVPFDPAVLRIHETVCTGDGALIGALFDPQDLACAPWSEELAGMAEQVAARLHDEDYFGPVCVDAFSWHDGERSRLRTLVDLNCRLSMSDGAYRLWRRVAPQQTLYYRFFNRRKLTLPADLADALAALGQYRYDSSARTGIFLASPLELGAGREARRPGKLAVIFVANTRPGIFELEQWFRKRFEA